MEQGRSIFQQDKPKIQGKDGTLLESQRPSHASAQHGDGRTAFNPFQKESTRSRVATSSLNGSKDVSSSGSSRTSA
eukprot:10436874-Prorocentrum_lima.AAC.1